MWLPDGKLEWLSLIVALIALAFAAYMVDSFLKLSPLLLSRRRPKLRRPLR